MKIINVPCKYNKSGENGYLRQDEATIRCINTETSSTVTAHYFKGISNNGDNIVMVVIKI